MRSVTIGMIRDEESISREWLISEAQACLGHKAWVKARVNDFLKKVITAGEVIEDGDGILTLPQGTGAYSFYVEISDEEAGESPVEPED